MRPPSMRFSSLAWSNTVSKNSKESCHVHSLVTYKLNGRTSESVAAYLTTFATYRVQQLTSWRIVHMAMFVLKNGHQKHTCHHSRFNNVDNWASMSWFFKEKEKWRGMCIEGCGFNVVALLHLSSMWPALFTQFQPFDRIGKHHWIWLVLAIQGECHYKFKDCGCEMPN